MSWSALRDLLTEEVEIASHSNTHPQLDRLAAAQAQDEAVQSKRLIQDALALDPSGFAYPYGYWDRNSRRMVAASGYGYACGVGEIPAVPSDDPFALPRLSVNAGITISEFDQILRLKRTRTLERASFAKRVAWRALRDLRLVHRMPRSFPPS